MEKNFEMEQRSHPDYRLKGTCQQEKYEKILDSTLNGKMRLGAKNSPWISSLRGIDPKSQKCEYEVQRHWFRLNLRSVCRRLRSLDGFC